MSSTLFGLIALGLAVVLFGVMLLVIEIGRRIGTRAMARDPVAANTGKGIVDGAVFGLLGLLVAFTFSGAATRSVPKTKRGQKAHNSRTKVQLTLVAPDPNNRPAQDGQRRLTAAPSEESETWTMWWTSQSRSG